MDRSFSRSRRLLSVVGFGIVTALGVASAQAQELCGGVDYPFPYTDVASVGAAFCPGIMEAYVIGLTKGTTPTTFSPDETVTRVQMTTFLQRSLDQGVTRASRRTILKQLQTNTFSQSVHVGASPIFCAADGASIWVAAYGTVVKVDASTGTVLGTWTGAANSWAPLWFAGRILVVGNGDPGALFAVDPSSPPGTAAFLIGLPGGPSSIAYDGTNIWTANFSGSVSRVNLDSISVTSVSTGFSAPAGILYDGASIWVTDYGADKLFQLDPTGAIINTVPVGSGPQQPVFDGQNIWVPSSNDNSITVVQASTAKVVATITSNELNGLSGPEQASFDGERILVTNTTGNSLTLFRAADLSVIANIPTPIDAPYGACSDGINFWITFSDDPFMLRF
jgi:hypothetical protein